MPDPVGRVATAPRRQRRSNATFTAPLRPWSARGAERRPPLVQGEGVRQDRPQVDPSVADQVEVVVEGVSTLDTIFA